jgi:type II secretory pathway pseudopilin PulG
MSANVQSARPRKGLAIASMVLGIASIPTLGLFAVGAIISIVLGTMALNKIKQNPQVYGGRNLAITGIITSAVSLALIAVFGILAAITLPALQEYLKRGHETATIHTLRTIHQNQLQFNAMTGKFGSLQELNQAGLFDQAYLNGRSVNGYVYSASDVSNVSYCVHADRAKDGTSYQDFVICEDGIIYYLESKTKGTVKRGEGTPLGLKPAEPTAKP